MIQDVTSKANNNAQWYSAGDKPDPSPLPIVRGYKLLIRPIAPPTKTSRGGIIIPEQTLEVQGFTRAVGRVLAMGEKAYDDKGEPWCQVGDTVLYGRHVGMKFIYGGIYLLILNDDEISAVLPDASMMFD